jgi:hypothetical protein
LLIMPAKVLGNIVPVFHTRWDTNERDLVIFVQASDYAQYWVPEIINED